MVIDSNVTNYTLSSLFPATEYEISLIAVRGSQESKVVKTSVFTGKSIIRMLCSLQVISKDGRVLSEWTLGQIIEKSRLGQTEWNSDTLDYQCLISSSLIRPHLCQFLKYKLIPEREQEWDGWMLQQTVWEHNASGHGCRLHRGITTECDVSGMERGNFSKFGQKWTEYNGSAQTCLCFYFLI